MANHKTTDQPGSNDLQPGRERSRNQNAQNSGGQRPNGEKTMTNANKTRQGAEDEHFFANDNAVELTEARGDHEHLGHSGRRNGSRK
ncbi:hypothetical protein [Spirosoma foliorum]|uniref:Uncharacterized protein n=1 Tax=Spirosoma foliorum TaxID=2710596 RepID=A0A7G5GQJ2_9BACT|nr:hypothetical protein [Spirosoma foliorum]QMW01134.1 hypothetical protein H3H32_24615 [Spirosoma foliorum]